ncbi:MAG: hypothetical protein ACXV8X_10095 [Candidatus Angelobacter sp.]
MTARKKNVRPNRKSDELWLSPKSNLKSGQPERAWNELVSLPQSSRLLELADVALGTKKKEAPKRRAAAAGTKS